MRSLFLAPHNDDETLFGAFTLIREKPVVVIVTDSHIQFQRGDGITADQRWEETCRALDTLGCIGVRLGIPDDLIYDFDIAAAVRARVGGDIQTVYAPAFEGGHKHHDLVHFAAMSLAPQVFLYPTYSPTSRSYSNRGKLRLDGTVYEHQLKAEAWGHYRSQHPRSGHHYEATVGKPEWLTEVR